MDIFGKYKERGAYHWEMVYGRKPMKQNPMQRARYDVTVRVLRQYFGSNAVKGVDVGCGDGVLIYKAQQAGYQIIGLDLVHEGLDLAQHQLHKYGVSDPALVLADSCELPLPDNAVDFVASVEVIEHVNHTKQYLSEIRRILRPGGMFVCTTPRRISPDDPMSDPYHVIEFMPEQLEQVLSQHFDNVLIQGLYPRRMRSLYTGYTGVGLVDKALRYALRLYSVYSNPFEKIHTDVLKDDCSTLIGIGYA